MPTCIALLRGVNVTGANRVPMAELRQHCEKAGFRDVRTYINSGNVVFTTKGKTSAAERTLEAIVAKEFGVTVPVVVRTAEQWTAYLNVPKAFTQAAQDAPNSLLVGFPQQPPSKDAAKTLAPRALNGERMQLQGDVLWIHYGGGVAGSKVSPAAIDKAMGSPTTARNLNTVRKLAEMAGVAGASTAPP